MNQAEYNKAFRHMVAPLESEHLKNLTYHPSIRAAARALLNTQPGELPKTISSLEKRMLQEHGISYRITAMLVDRAMEDLFYEDRDIVCWEAELAETSKGRQE